MLATLSQPKELSIYIHWPFCKSKCPYCDFNSHVRDKINQQAWHAAYINEIQKHNKFLKSTIIRSIFFGGGTPSLMPSSLVKAIIDKFRELAILNEKTEITLEANPTSVESIKFEEFAASGVNRVSLGIQAFREENLKFLGREHNVTEALDAIALAKKYFQRYSFDLIYALPTQTINEWATDLTQALKFAGDHLSLYQLTIEKGTKFYSLHQKQKFIMPNDELARDFYCITQEIMSGQSMPAYEISNHAKPGGECLHNITYWQYKDFLGLGPGAHSRVKNQAFHSVYHPENWLHLALCNKSTDQKKVDLSLEDQIQEMLLMGLRLSKGINEELFKAKIGKSFFDVINGRKLELMIKSKLLKYENNHLSTTDDGKLVLNSILNQLFN